MIVDLYEHFRDHYTNRKLIGDGCVFVEFKNPIKAEDFKLWTEANVLCYVLNGRKDWTAVDKTYSATTGNSLLLRKGVYNTKQYFDEESSVLLFFLSDDYLRNFIEENTSVPKIPKPGVPREQVFEIPHTPLLESLYFTVFNYLQQSEKISTELVNLKVKELLNLIAIDPANRNLLCWLNTLHQTSKTDLDTVMQKNFHFDLDMDEYARLSGRSLATFKRDFKKKYNDTPRNWLNSKRLQYARSLLISSELNMSEVCFECGFRNVSHFNKLFKEHFGLTPSQYKSEKIAG